MLITLLTHAREIDKSSNTGGLVLENLGGLTGTDMPRVRRVIWQRRRADALLLHHLRQYRSALVYPAAGVAAARPVGAPDHYIIIDATWQQAQKMLHQSPYLFHLPRLSLPAVNSTYRLRRNQRRQGLCTSETAARLLRQRGHSHLAQRLDGALAELQGPGSLTD